MIVSHELTEILFNLLNQSIIKQGSIHIHTLGVNTHYTHTHTIINTTY